MHEGRRSEDGFWGAVNKYWPVITSISLAGWVALRSVERVTVLENKMMDVVDLIKEGRAEEKDYRAQVRVEMQAIRDDVKEMARVWRRQ